MEVSTISVYVSLNVVLFRTGSSPVMCVDMNHVQALYIYLKFLTLLQRRTAGCMYVRILSLGKGFF